MLSTLVSPAAVHSRSLHGYGYAMKNKILSKEKKSEKKNKLCGLGGLTRSSFYFTPYFVPLTGSKTHKNRR